MLFFCLFQCFEEKEYQTESKRNETFGNVIFSPNMIDLDPTPRRNRGGHEGGPPRAHPLPRGPPVAPPTYSFLLYIPTYPQTIRTGAKNLIPPPQPSVPVISHLGTFSGALLEGDSIMEVFYINTITSPMKRE